MIRVNLRIQELVSPSLHKALEATPIQGRAERLRLLATMGLGLEARSSTPRDEAVTPGSLDADGLDDTDIAKIFGETT